MLAGCVSKATELAPPAPVGAQPHATASPTPGRPDAAVAAASCDAPAFNAAAADNTASLTASAWMFSAGTSEKPEGPGWEVYAPAIQRAIATACAPTTSAFALKLSQLQTAHGVRGDGVMSRETAEALKSLWQAKRAHVARPCIALPHDDTAPIPQAAAYDDRDARLSPPALAAYLAMLDAAKAAHPELFKSRGLLLAVSPWRDPAADRSVCASNPAMCNGTAKTAGCSAHWSGRAVDINLGFIPGGDPTDSTYANRLAQSKNPLYGWLLDHAGEFGFVNYYYEPWHWEWQGDAP